MYSHLFLGASNYRFRMVYSGLESYKNIDEKISIGLFIMMIMFSASIMRWSTFCSILGCEFRNFAV